MGKEEKGVFFRSPKSYHIKVGLKCLHDIVQEGIKMEETLGALKVYRITSY